MDELHAGLVVESRVPEGECSIESPFDRMGPAAAFHAEARREVGRLEPTRARVGVRVGRAVDRVNDVDPVDLAGGLGRAGKADDRGQKIAAFSGVSRGCPWPSVPFGPVGRAGPLDLLSKAA